MQFLIIARDYQDKEALSRRLAVRNAHIALSNAAIARGEQLFGVAMCNEKGEMCGSVMVVDMPSRKYVDEWLQGEPYVTAKVWEHVEVVPCKIGPSFEAMIAAFVKL